MCLCDMASDLTSIIFSLLSSKLFRFDEYPILCSGFLFFSESSKFSLTNLTLKRYQ